MSDMPQTTITDTSSNFGLPAVAHYLKLAHTLEERYFKAAGKPLGDKSAAKIALDRLDSLKSEVVDIMNLPQTERDAAAIEFGYQKRMDVPQYMGSALMIARSIAADDKKLPQGTNQPDAADPAQMELTKENFTKLANGLAKSIEYLAELHAQSPKSQSQPNVILFGQSPASTTIKRVLPTVISTVYNTDGVDISTFTNATILQDKHGIDAPAKAQSEIKRRYEQGFNQGKQKVTGSPAPSTTTENSWTMKEDDRRNSLDASPPHLSQ